jgi:hypothetical protein
MASKELTRVRELADVVRGAEERLDKALLQARDDTGAGASWAELATALGGTRSAARARWNAAKRRQEQQR